MQMDVHKTLYCFYTTKKMPHESTRSIRIYFQFWNIFQVKLYTSLPQECTFCHPLQCLLNKSLYHCEPTIGVGRGSKATWILKISPKSLFCLFRVGKSKFHHFWPPWKNILVVPPWKKILPTPMNSTQLSLKRTWTINNHVNGSHISLCWLNRTHFRNLLFEWFSALRLSEMLFLFINCLISIFASTFYK